VGDQSSGKSSVLEALSGIPFPSGAGLVTRCPVRLVLRCAVAGTSWSCLVSTTASSQTITPKTRQELPAIILRLSETLTHGSNSDLSADTIVVQISSPESPDLILVDLPGIVRTATAGQGSQVITQIDNLITDYLKQENTIILAIIPANQDIATIDILERARLVDPAGERTLGVLTKPDLVGTGNEEEVAAIVKNIRKPLRLGFIMVKNRSQFQNEEGISYQAAKEDEELFFRDHPTFSCLDQRLLGSSNLALTLTKLLVLRIKETLAPMKRQVEVMLSSIRADVRAVSSYGSASCPSERQKLLVTLTQEFVRHLNDCVRGEYRDRLIVCNPSLRLYTRALIIFQELQTKVAATAPHFRVEDFITNLAHQMEALRGRELPGFMSAQSFYMFIQEFINAWSAPARMAAAQMRALANEVVRELFGKIAVSYPLLRASFREVASTILETSEDEALRLLEGLIVREKDPFTINEFLQAHINKLRYDRFESSVDDAFRGTIQDSSGSGSWQATKEHVGASLRSWYRTAHGVSSSANAEDMSAILEAYWTLASKRFVDNACMCLDDRILGTLCGKVQEACYQFVHDEAKLEAFFTEDEAMVARRTQLERTRDELIKANAAMNNIQAARKPTPRSQKSTLMRSPPSHQLKITVAVRSQGLGLQLADEGGRVSTAFPNQPSHHLKAGCNQGISP